MLNHLFFLVLLATIRKLSSPALPCIFARHRLHSPQLLQRVGDELLVKVIIEAIEVGQCNREDWPGGKDLPGDLPVVDADVLSAVVVEEVSEEGMEVQLRAFLQFVVLIG